MRFVTAIAAIGLLACVGLGSGRQASSPRVGAGPDTPIPAPRSGIINIAGRPYRVTVVMLRVLPGTVPDGDPGTHDDNLIVTLAPLDGRLMLLRTPPIVSLTYQGERWQPTLEVRASPAATYLYNTATYGATGALTWPTGASMTARVTFPGRRRAMTSITLNDVVLNAALPTE